MTQELIGDMLGVRLSLWLLTFADRLHSEELPATQELMPIWWEGLAQRFPGQLAL